MSAGRATSATCGTREKKVRCARCAGGVRTISPPSHFSRSSRIHPMSVIRFEELECWQKAKTLAVTLYQISKDGEFGRDFGLRDQIRRAAISIASNIAEGKERETVSEFIRYLYVAKGSAGEVMTQVIIAEEVGYLDREKSIRTQTECPATQCYDWGLD